MIKAENQTFYKFLKNHYIKNVKSEKKGKKFKVSGASRLLRDKT